MRKGYLYLLIFIISFLMFSCKEEPVDTKAMTSIATLQNIRGKDVIIEVFKGDYWDYTYKKGIWPVKTTPQVVVWTENLKGEYIETLYITRKFGKQFYRNAPEQTNDSIIYKESLPYWLHKRTTGGFVAPTRAIPMPDSITSATPTTDTALFTKIPTDTKIINILLEINIEHDGNDMYPDNAEVSDPEYTGKSGQPALVYGVQVDLEKGGKYEMKILGHSSPSGLDGKLYSDLNGITSALKMINKIAVIVPPQ